MKPAAVKARLFRAKLAEIAKAALSKRYTPDQIRQMSAQARQSVYGDKQAKGK